MFIRWPEELPRDGCLRTYWSNAIHDPDDLIRWEALGIILCMMEPSLSIPVFISAIETDRFWGARAQAAQSLQQIASFEHMHPALEPFLSDVISTLVKALADESEFVQLSAADALEAIAQADASPLPRPEAVSKSDNSFVREVFADAMRAIRGEPWIADPL